MSDTNPPASEISSGMGLWMSMWACVIVGVIISGVLAYETYQLNQHGRSTGLPGCGGGTFDCGSVLTSPYGRFGNPNGSSGGGFSVTYLAFGFYAVVITVLGLSRPNRDDGPRLFCFLALPVLGAMGLGTAAWAAWAMVKLREVCPWCVAVHAANLVLFFLTVAFAKKFWEARTAEGWDPGFANRLAMGTMLAALAALAFQMTFLMKFHDAELAFDPSDDFERLKLEGDPREQIIWSESGNRDTDNVVVMYSCFTCPRCKEAHDALYEVLARHSTEMRLQLRFNPLSPSCNPQVPPPPMPEHQFACPLATIGLAVAEVQPDAFNSFAHWLYQNQEGMTPLVAEAEARKRVSDIDKFNQALDESSPLGQKIQQRIRNDVDLAKSIDLLSVPQIFMSEGQLRGVITTEKVERLLGRAYKWDSVATE